MARWINVDKMLCQISHWEDTTFPFGVFMDEYGKMDDHSLPLHWHEMLEFCIVLSGKVQMRIDDQLLELNVDDCVFINSNTLHSGKQLIASENALVCTVSFSPYILTKSLQTTVYQKYFKPLVGTPPSGFKFDRSTTEGGTVHDLLCELSEIEKDSFGYELAVISKISAIWLHTLLYIKENEFGSQFEIISPSRTGGIMKSLLIYVQENYAKDISVEILSSYAHISRSECFNCFKQHTGKAPLEYVNNYRLAQAEHLLRTTSLSILEICSSCGFSGQSYFGEVFKNRYGMSPAKYRKTVSENLPT